MSHTPLPWRIDREHPWRIRADSLEFPLADIDYRCGKAEQTANAEFIVRAVNCHAELVSALDHIANQTSMDNARQIARAAIQSATKGNQ